MHVSTPRRPKPSTPSTTGAPAAPPALPPPTPSPTGGERDGGRTSKTTLSSQIGADARNKKALEEVKISLQGNPAEAPPTSLAPPETTAATPKAIAASAPDPGAPATNGGEASANAPTPAPSAVPVASPALPVPGPAAPGATPDPTAAPTMAHAVQGMLARGQEEPAEEAPPATSQSGSAAVVASPEPPPASPLQLPASSAASEPSEEEPDPDAEMKRLFNSLLQRALSDPGTRQALAASFGNEVSRLLDRALKPINDRLQAPQPVPATQQEVATIGTKLRDHMDAKFETLKGSLVTDIAAKLSELGRPATAEDVKAAVEHAASRVEQQIHDVGVAINDHTDAAGHATAQAVNAATEGYAAALGGQVDAARSAANAAAQNAQAAAENAHQAASNALGVGSEVNRLGRQFDGIHAAAEQVANGTHPFANQLLAALAGINAPRPAPLPPSGAGTPPTDPGAPLPGALGAGMGPSPVVDAGPGGQDVVAAGAPLPTPPPVGPRPLQGPARDARNTAYYVCAAIALILMGVAQAFSK